jgi:hypothetical protein
MLFGEWATKHLQTRLNQFFHFQANAKYQMRFEPAVKTDKGLKMKRHKSNHTVIRKYKKPVKGERLLLAT